MSDKESEFLKELDRKVRSALMKIVITVIVAIAVAAVSFLVFLPARVSAMETTVKVINENYVDNKRLALITDAINDQNRILAEAFDNHKQFDRDEFDRINKRIDDLIREMIPYNTRGADNTN